MDAQWEEWKTCVLVESYLRLHRVYAKLLEKPEALMPSELRPTQTHLDLSALQYASVWSE